MSVTFIVHGKWNHNSTSPRNQVNVEQNVGGISCIAQMPSMSISCIEVVKL